MYTRVSINLVDLNQPHNICVLFAKTVFTFSSLHFKDGVGERIAVRDKPTTKTKPIIFLIHIMGRVGVYISFKKNIDTVGVQWEVAPAKNILITPIRKKI